MRKTRIIMWWLCFVSCIMLAIVSILSNESSITKGRMLIAALSAFIIFISVTVILKPFNKD